MYAYWCHFTFSMHLANEDEDEDEDEDNEKEGRQKNKTVIKSIDSVTESMTGMVELDRCEEEQKWWKKHKGEA
ncbi:hypothetical protein HN011_001891 [Eciton burchellii]|nr:hypothetical protein HN011_001891 [Eciton burchellii]